MLRIFSVIILNLILSPNSAFGQPIDSSILFSTRLQTQMASSGLELNAIDLIKIKEDKIKVAPEQMGLPLKEILSPTSKYNDSKKVDSLAIQVARGGDMSGGGSTLLQGNQRFFLDLYNENLNLSLSSCRIGSIQPTKFFLSRFIFEDSCLNQPIMQILDRSKKVAPRLYQSFVAIYRNLPFYFSSGKFRILDENFYLSPDKQFGSQMIISTTALYIKNLGIVISFPQFLELSEAHQAGLVIHELLRSMQIQFSLKMTNAEIQEIVAALFSADETRLLATLKKSGLRDFLELKKNKDPMLEEIFSYYSELIYLNPDLGHVEVKRIEKLLRSETATWSFDLSDVLAETSHEILVYRQQSKQKNSQSEVVRLEGLEQKMDRMVAQVRAQGIREIYISSLDRVAELTGFLLNHTRYSLSYCADVVGNDQPCSSLSQKLKVLIN